MTEQLSPFEEVRSAQVLAITYGYRDLRVQFSFHAYIALATATVFWNRIEVCLYRLRTAALTKGYG
jgi:hypothetical protein